MKPCWVEPFPPRNTQKERLWVGSFFDHEWSPCGECGGKSGKDKGPPDETFLATDYGPCGEYLVSSIKNKAQLDGTGT
ncbi:hypothetical protein SAMN02745181_0330 [Rubritalea squalenifaciens DSM 18772]|uniref:Uncharacterized protein n=1 Tax=Rubritalea squalenifaciens DSM 18772 TaxID=1123071 RepID=A0A1M6BXI2_9BACT|nr:hypothetical protein SAMN02745181_0330 [Rubritalea squalenifaciens DSM 18772]